VASRERYLLQHGELVDAHVTHVWGHANPGNNAARQDPIPVKMTARLADGRTVQLEGLLPEGPGRVTVGDTIQLRVDPKDASRWMEPRELTPWAHELAITYVLLGLLAVLVAIALWQRARVLHVWREGIEDEGLVVDLRHSPMAPASRLVRFSLSSMHSRRIHSTLYPVRRGLPEVGEAIGVLRLRDEPERMIVAELYR
jgi:hypothetical protein